MLNRETVLYVLNGKMKAGAETLVIDALKGDASNRSYYRIRYTARGLSETRIVMELAEPEAIKKSEEQVSSPAPAINELPFVNIQRRLAGAKVAVPRLDYYDPAAGLLLLEDLGDQTLEMEVRQRGEEAAGRYYRMAIDELVKIQRISPGSSGRDCLAFGRAFDRALLMWEFDHFLEFGIEARQGMMIRPSDREAIHAEFLEISERLAAEPKVFTHRDYHSRNLMIHRDRIGVLDFQDALMGPCVYDLASLLRDSYVALSDPAVEALIDYYLEARAAGGAVKEKMPDRAGFRRLFDFMSLQRNLKAAGRFVYIDVVKKKDHLLPYIPQTLGYVRRTLGRHEELGKLRSLLTSYVEEFR